jgi:quercetin dioxygenase-like cupin family protein
MVSRFSLSLFLLVALPGCAGRAAPDAAAHAPLGSVATDLLRQRLADEFTPGREVIVSLVEIPPHTRLERHFHPGEEFHYYLEGEVEMDIDGEPPRTGRAGTTGHIPFRRPHTAITHASRAKILVFRVHTAGEPVRYVAE